MSRALKVAFFVFWVAAVLLLIALTSVALAQNGTPPAPTPAARQQVTADDVNRIAKQMYCPVCENEPLDACRTAACQQWRAQIGQMLSEGPDRTADQRLLRSALWRAGAGAASGARHFVVAVCAADRRPDRRRGDRRVAAAPLARARRSGSPSRRLRLNPAEMSTPIGLSKIEEFLNHE